MKGFTANCGNITTLNKNQNKRLMTNAHVNTGIPQILRVRVSDHRNKVNVVIKQVTQILVSQCI